MAFRDDEAARRLRIETLEKELASARTDHGKATAAERKEEEKRDELGKRVAELEEKLREAKREPEPEKEPDPPKAPQPIGPQPGLVSRAWTAITAAFWPVVIVAGASSFLYCSIQDCRPACRPVDRHIEVDIPGEVTTANGVNMPVGTRCRIHALFFADRDDELHLWESEVRATCGGRVVFEGGGLSSCAVQQVRRDRGWGYTVPNCVWNDDEIRLGWVGDKISLSTSSWSYEIRVPAELKSRQALYDPVLIDSRIHEPLAVLAEVIVISGASPVQPGTSCMVMISPAENVEENCTVSVRCGERLLRSTAAQCGVRQGVPISASGPGVTVDMAAGLVRVEENGGPGVPYMASLRITPD